MEEETQREILQLLPEGIIDEILCRLPAKSLIRLNCTSRHWNSVISDPTFPARHFKLASQRKALVQRILLSEKSRVRSLAVETSSIYVEDSQVVCPFKPPESDVMMLASCNGMVLVALIDDDVIADEFYIWNPTTVQFIKLPNPPNLEEYHRECEQIFGFGYVSASDEYKVMFYDGYETPSIFSSRANGWKAIDQCDLLPFYALHDKGALLNEAIHWMDYSAGRGAADIVAFDLAKENFRKMDSSCITSLTLSEVGQEEYYIHDLEGCLCTAVIYYPDWGVPATGIRLWVMKEYGVCETWTQFFHVNLADHEYALACSIFHTGRSLVLWRFKHAHNENIRGYDLVLLEKDVERFGGRYVFEAALGYIRPPSGFYTFDSLYLSCDMIHYEETVLWFNDNLGVEENFRLLGT